MERLTMSETNEYVVLLPGDEALWEAATDEERRVVYARHHRFMELLRERGHEVTGGAELTHSRGAIQVRGDLDAISVTDGPYAETTEQLTGFYVIRSSDLDDLLNLCGLLAADVPGSPPVEVRRTGSMDPAAGSEVAS
jgi:hypothetical protein